MRSWLLLAACVGLALPMRAEPDAALRVDFSNPGLMPAQWTLVLHPDGSGHFHAERGTAKLDADHGMEPARVDRDVQLSSAFAAKVFEVVHRHHDLQGAKCESHLKVAFQGWKTLTYTGPDGSGSCEFNYSKDKEIQELGDSFMAVASTIVEGARLELLLQHDPLGLAQEIEFVQDGARDGRLQEICAIRGILQKLEEDSSVMELVRRRARVLLAESEK
ncbi:MAG TPA: hypothetical protein VG893_02645 [Terracidiphilus sp.]|nr:hypothetical protein [Terracidiphilus sp.]